jgi:ribonuclease P protein component
VIGRIQDRGTFDALRRDGSRSGCGVVRLTYVAGTRANAPDRCVAYAISKKVGRAVERNRVRRQLRAIFAEMDQAALPPGSYLVAVRPGAAELPFMELRNDVERALSRLTRRLGGARFDDTTSATIVSPSHGSVS